MAGWGRAPQAPEPEPGVRCVQSGDTQPGMTLPPDWEYARALQNGQPPGGPWPQQRPPRRRRRFGRFVRRTFAVLLVIVFIAAVSLGGLLVLTPSAGDASQLAQAQSTGHGVAYPGPAVPARFAEALVATEDHRFYSDPGIDPIAVGRVALGYLTGHGPQQGGATITQQLAKMLYTPGQSGIKAEAEQIALAIKLNMTYTKAQILQMYAEVAYYGENYYSLGAASCGYFGVAPSALTWPQAAMLAGVVNGPSLYNPLTQPQQAHAREGHVLSRLVATGTLTQAQADAALSQSLGLVPRYGALSAPPAGSDTCGN
jgi:membrane peptidoglycan carboxypeptidase